MKIYLDNIVYYLQRFGGISVYWNELTKHIIQQKEFITKFIEIPNAPIKFVERISAINNQIVYDQNLNLNVLRYLPISKQKVDSDSILHSSYYRYTKKKGVKNIITVYDFTYEYFRNGLAKKIHQLQKSQAIKNAEGIICISENTKKDLLRFYPNLDEKKIRVIHLASSDLYYKNENLDIKDTPYNLLTKKKIISFVGSRVKYKNFNIVVELIKRLPDEYHLLIIGGGNLTIIENQSLLSVSQRYTHLQNINSKELNDIYNISFCYLYPSEYEGFGIPILEAMQAGCPVLCQNISSIPEVYGKVGNIVFKSNNIDEFYQNIRRLEDFNYRNKIVQQGFENAKRFCWKKTCDDTLDFYKYILKS